MTGFWDRFAIGALGVPSSRPVVIAIDDGPCETTAANVETVERFDLDRLNVEVIFFFVGDKVRASEDVFDVVHGMGSRPTHAHQFQIGNHTQSHARLPELADPELRDELAACHHEIREILGIIPHAFRPPFSAADPRASAVAVELGYEREFARSSVGDYDLNSDAIVAASLESAAFSRFIGLHDDVPATVEALPRILAGLADRGLVRDAASAFGNLPAGVL